MKTILWIQGCDVVSKDILIVDGQEVEDEHTVKREISFLYEIQKCHPLLKKKSNDISNNLNIYENCINDDKGFIIKSVLSENHRDEQGRLRPFMFYSNDTDKDSFIGSLKSELDKLGLAPYDKDIEFINNGGFSRRESNKKVVLITIIVLIIVVIIAKCI